VTALVVKGLLVLTPERRRALKMLANSRHGLNEELFISGHDYKRPMLIGPVRRTRNSRARGDED